MNERDLFLSALEIEDPAARRAHLQSACADNVELLSRVESLLASHEGESRFLQTPVGEQLGDDPTGQAAATIVMGTGSTQDEAPDAGDAAASSLDFSHLNERNKMAEETPLDYLEPSTKPGSLGRLAHYEILEVVGSGAFGTVLRAFDDKLQRVVAIKVMAPELAATSPARKRFIREAQASAAIRHENVVSVYAVEEKPIPYLVMEYIPGETLQHRLDDKGPLDVPAVLRLGTQIAEGLAAAHAKDLIHRDIKPGNILLETGMRDRVKITDFGLARAADDASMTQSGVIAGTPMYMAPEQALGHKLDQRADLFSLGSVLYQMVSGRPPFRASSTLAVLKRLTEETPRPIQEIIPETPQWLCDIIARLHAKNPDDRFQTAKEVAELLDQHLAHLQNPSQVLRPASVSLAQAAKPRTGPEMRPLMVPQGIRWPLLIATAIMFLAAVLLLAVTESTGLTHLFRGQQAMTDPIKPGGDPTLIVKEPLPPTFTSSIGMEFVIVPKGKSWLGGGRVKLGDKEVEFPADFYLGKYEVTQEEWQKVMGENPSFFSRTGTGKDRVNDIPDADLKRFPVETLTWDQCQIFVEKLNRLEKETGWVYRLPKEAEWEYACRGGPMLDKLDSAFDFYFAKPTNTLLPEQANFNKGLNRSCKVGSYEPNRLGLFDMHGNVLEWCEDTGKAVGGETHRVRRGGGWDHRSGDLLAALHIAIRPSVVSFSLGLRLARVPSGAPSPEAETPSTDPDRLAAEYVLSIGGAVQVKDQAEFIDAVANLPPESFRLITVHLLWKAQVTDADLARFKDCKELGAVVLIGAPHVSDAGLAHFKDCKNLVEVGLSYTQVSDAGLAHFQDRKNLLALGLEGTKLSDAGLAHFKDCKNLTDVRLTGTKVSDVGLAHFKDCKDLTRLSLGDTQVSDAGLAHFKDCKNLVEVRLSHTQVSDAGLAHFKGMPLEALYIDNTGITDLTPLQGMPLVEICLTPKNITRGLDILRDMKSLKTIGIESDHAWPAAEFWERYDKGEFK